MVYIAATLGVDSYTSPKALQEPIGDEEAEADEDVLGDEDDPDADAECAPISFQRMGLACEGDVLVAQEPFLTPADAPALRSVKKPGLCGAGPAAENAAGNAAAEMEESAAMAPRRVEVTRAGGSAAAR